MSVMTLELLAQIVEATLLAAGQPLSVERLQALFEEQDRPSKADLHRVLEQLQQHYQHRAVELKQVASGYRFQVREHLSEWVSKLWEERPSRYSRALLETLAIIAYQQPVTRGEIEDIRGVVVSTGTIRTLQERGWIQVVGYRDSPGRPAMYATTQTFLDYFSLLSLEELPPLADIKALSENSIAFADDGDGLAKDYDLSCTQLTVSDMGELEQTQEDIDAAEALVAQVEKNLAQPPQASKETDLDSDSKRTSFEDLIHRLNDPDSPDFNYET